MDNKELEALFAQHHIIARNLDELYEFNEGEVTEQTELQESAKQAIAEIIDNDGVDFLGRWLMAKEAEEQALEAEAKYIENQIKDVRRKKEYIKGRVREALAILKKTKVYGHHGYSFTAAISTTTSVDTTLLNDTYQHQIEDAVRGLNLPADISISLKASVSKVPKGAELPAYYIRTQKEAITFRKPLQPQPSDTNSEEDGNNQ